FCAIFIANLHGIATRTLSVSVFSFFELRIKKTARYGGWSMHEINHFIVIKSRRRVPPEVFRPV
ncbi:hypothetical protein, partial [Escherichia coli]|uniref:hypothetical protein n=1 Tax=Escherichia coli TaxID=562 RepID=UPI00193EB15F